MLNALVDTVGMRAVMDKRRHRSAVKLALSDARSRSSSLKPVKCALEQAYNRTVAMAERDTWKRIERRRRELSERTDTVRDIDYGAGFPESPYSEDQQCRGVETNITVKEMVSFSKHAVWAEVLYCLTRILLPKKVTCVGISGSYIAAAMQFNNRGRLWTIEGSPAAAVLAKQTFQTLGLSNRVTSLIGPFRDTLEPCLREQCWFDLVFVDGHHDGKATVSYFQQLKPHLSKNAVVVFDDIICYAGMAQAWNEISAEPSVKDFVRLGEMGAVVL
jgi:predicted O-methyltransferase YrrM